MRSSDIFDGVTDIRDDIIDGAAVKVKVKGTDKAKKKRSRRLRWISAVAAMLVLVIAGGVMINSGGALKVYAISEAEYPKMAKYPGEWYTEGQFDAWRASVRAQQRDLGDMSDLVSFFAESARTFLADADGDNIVYSPLNVYMVLSMLAELTDGESREQILTLLGSDGIESLRRRASDVWNCNYRDDGARTTVLASSLWLNENVSFNKDTMDTLASEYYASSYRGQMGSEEFDRALHEWLNKQTGNLLSEEAEQMGFDDETVLALATTVYLRAKWSFEFSKENTTPQTFHGADGDLTVDFMHQRDDQSYYWGDKFAAVSQSFEDGGAMWFILPDEGVSPEELLDDAEASAFIFSPDRAKSENSKYLFVNKSIPKFDVSSELDLADGLQKLGVTDVFDDTKSDFSPMTDDDIPIWVTSVDHAARVVIDEEGCTAAAFTVMVADGAPMPPDDEVDFVLDRPFLFCITGDSGLPLFVGIVNDPTA